jgi:hypothetical protein
MIIYSTIDPNGEILGKLIAINENYDDVNLEFDLKHTINTSLK